MDREESVPVIPSLVRIAKLENGVVKLDEEPLKAISPETITYPVAVVTVIGRTEEQRGAILKGLVECLYTKASDDSCALIANYSKRNEVDGIFAVFPPGKITNESGVERAVLILDISCTHYASPAYSKLADLCLLVSSVVIYTASCNGDKMTNINIEMSELKSVGPSVVTINHVWVIVQDCDSSVSPKPGAVDLLTAEYENLGLSERTKEEALTLARYFHSDSAIRILLPKRSNEVEDHPLQGDSAEYNVALKETCCTILETATQIAGVRLGFINSHFRQKFCPVEAQVALASVNLSCKSSSQESYASAVKQSTLSGDRAATCSSRGIGRGRKLSQNYQCQDISTPFKHDTKQIKSADAKPIEIDSTNEMSGNEYAEDVNFDQWSGFGLSTVCKKTYTRDQQKAKYTIPVDRCVPEIRVTDSETVGIQTELVALTLSKEPVEKLMDVSLEAEDCTVEIGQEPEPMEVDISCVSVYRELMNDYIKKSSQFLQEMHTDVLKKLRTRSFPITSSDMREIEAVYEELCQKNMQSQETYEEISEKQTTPSSNSTRRNVRQAHFCDPIVAKNAIEYSLERYTEFMGVFVPPHDVYTIKYITDVHELACLLVLDAFSFEEISPVFEKGKKKLQDILSASLQERLEANFAMMRKLDKKEEKLRRMCGTYYKDQMSTKMREKTVSSEKATEIHEEAMHDTKQWFRNQCKDVLKPIKDYWEKVLDVKFEFWKTYYMDEFEIKQDLPYVAGSSLSAQNEQPIKKANVGIYFGPDVVQFGLYSSDIEAFNQSCVEMPPLICFKDEKILIGDEAKNCETRKYNVFDIISRPTETLQRRSVKLYAKSFILTSNEIAVLFFHEAKKKFESSVKTELGTCAVAASGLLPSASKQGLIAALSMSGFSIVKFIPSTTAILVWYLKWRKGQLYKNPQKDPRVLVIHHTGALVEVVKAEISAGHHIKLRNIEGFLNYNDFNEPKGGKVVQSAILQAISEAKEQSRDFEQTIVIRGNQFDESIMDTIQKIVDRTFDSAHYDKQSHMHILFPAAAYDAYKNDDEDESVRAHWPQFPDFNNLFPHKLSIQKGCWKTINAKFPSSGSENYFVTLQRGESSFTVNERNNTGKIFCYPCNDKQVTRSSPAKFDVTLLDNGTFKISGAPLTCPNFQFISDSDLKYVKKQVAEVILEKKRFMEKSKASDILEENAAKDLVTLKATLRNQLKDAKGRLEVSRDSIKPMILDGINDRIKACEMLLSQPSVKEKQLNVAIGQLKVAASRIPSMN